MRPCWKQAAFIIRGLKSCKGEGDGIMYASFDDSNKYHIMLADRGYTCCGRQALRRPWVNFTASPPADHELCQYCEKSEAKGEPHKGNGGVWGREAL